MQKIPIRYIQTASKELGASVGFGIRDLQTVLAGKDMIQDLHRHDFFYMLVLKKGTGIHEIDFKKYKITNHSLFFMRPGQVHQLRLKGGSVGYLVEFNSDFYHTLNKRSDQLLRKASALNFHRFKKNEFDTVYSTLTTVFHEYNGKQERYQEAIKANLDILFIQLIRKCIECIAENSNPYAQEQMGKFCSLLEKHIISHKQASYYAGLLNLSLYQLNSITRAALGKTSSDIINDYIILESKRYLLSTSNQVKEIAYHLGYEDVSYFIRFFKKHTGFSPETFRNNSR
ncbi:MAG TPA: AraC family transcriptional regulator [Chitinophagaceae bacterium]|jgi:AraC-like DNA-binding protein|nr:AraC family transcriptional regulator [Chitinophagaceae bacterium]